MTVEEQTEKLKFIIGRFDHFYDSINNKGNLYLTINTFMVAGSLAGYFSLNAIHHFNPWVWILFFLPSISCNLISFAYTISAIRPFTRKHSTTNSLIFFADVANLSEEQWIQSWNSLTEVSWNDDLKLQTHILANGLHKKFESLSCATIFIGLQVTIFFLFSVYYFLTFKMQ